MRPKIISVISFCWAERVRIKILTVNITQSRQGGGDLSLEERFRGSRVSLGQVGASEKPQNSTQISKKIPFLLCHVAELEFHALKAPLQGKQNDLPTLQGLFYTQKMLLRQLLSLEILPSPLLTSAPPAEPT